MLVLKRKPGESVITSNGVRVVVCEIRGDQVRLGFEAPTSVGIYRQEVWQRMNEKGSDHE